MSTRLQRAGAILGLAVVEVFFGWHRYFSAAPDQFDDEGFFAVQLRQWIQGGALYDHIYSQYGPVHMLVFGLPLRVLGIEPTLTTGRLLTLFLHAGTAIVLAVVVLKLTGSLWSALLTQFAAFVVLWDLVWAAINPGTFLVLAAAALLLDVVALRPRHPRSSDWIIGTIVAVAALAKINVGGLMALAVAYVVACSGPTRLHRYLRPLTEIALVAIGPAILITGLLNFDELDSPIAATYPETAALRHWTVAYLAGAVLVVAFGRLWGGEAEDEPPFSISRLAGGFAVTSGAAIATIVAFGSSPVTLVESTVIRPLGQASTLTILPTMTALNLVWIALVPVLVVMGRRIVQAPRDSRTMAFSAALRLVSGFLVLLTATLTTAPTWAESLGFAPFAALVLLPRVGQARSTMLTGRRLLAAFTMVFTLQAFPVAVMQERYSALFAVVCAIVVLHDAGVEARAAVDAGMAVRLRPRTIAAAPTVATFLLLVLVWAPRFGDQWSAYRSGVAIGLPGADWIRTTPDHRAELHTQVEELRTCDQFVAFPGENALYLYTEIEPPTGFNPTFWPDKLTDREEDAVVEALESTPGRVCFKDTPGAYGVGVDSPGPLTSYLASNFTTVIETRSGHEIRVRDE